MQLLLDRTEVMVTRISDRRYPQSQSQGEKDQEKHTEVFSRKIADGEEGIMAETREREQQVFLLLFPSVLVTSLLFLFLIGILCLSAERSE